MGWRFLQRGVGGPQLRARLAAAPSAQAPAPCPACPVLAPSGGLRRGEQGGAHGQPPPLAGVRCRLPAPPAGPHAGRSWAVTAAPAAPLPGQRPHGGRGPSFPPRRPLGRSRAVVLRRPRLRRVGALACSAPGLSRCLVLLPLALPPAALAPSPSRPPPPPGAGERKRLTPAAAGTGGARLSQRTKKASPPVALTTCEKAQKAYFVQKHRSYKKAPPLRGRPFFPSLVSVRPSP